MLFEYSLNNLAFVRYSKMQLLLPLIPKMFLGFLGPQNSKNDKFYFRIIIRFIRYGRYPVTSLIYIYIYLVAWQGHRGDQKKKKTVAEFI